jgi:NhaP-type Na+/H+ or K+/H+ antiporter
MGSRFLSILLLMKTIAPWGYGMRLSEIVLLTYSGCRGALQLSMALLVVEEQSFSDQWSDIILFHVVGIVTLTMIINGSTTGLLVNLLRLSRT